MNNNKDLHMLWQKQS